MEAAAYLTKSYDPALVTLSVGVAMLAGYAALDLTDRVHAASRLQTGIWLAAGALILGSGIWSMHFIGMLALELPMTMRYAIGPTALSWLMAVVASAAALGLSCRAALERWTWLAGSLLMAVAIAGMHYTGMHAMPMAAEIAYQPAWVAFSLLVAFLGSAAALGLSFALRDWQRRLRIVKKLGAAALMGGAIAGMHYAGMAAAHFPATMIDYSGGGGVNPHWLAVLISSLSLVLLGSTLLAAAQDRRLEYRTANLVASLRDVNDQLHYSSYHDELTDLANRRLLDERLEAAMERAERAGTEFTVFYIDLDGFKALNDQLGHRAGDEVLARVAQGMRGTMREGDTVARIGGDEFLIVADAVPDDEQGRRLALRVLAAIRQSTHEAPGLSASIGWARYPAHGQTAEALVAAADLAMYNAKKNGKNGAVGYRPDMAAAAEAEFGLQRELADALARQHIVVYYQPKFTAASRALSGAEALVRWRHPQQGLIPPDRFIPAAERSGQIEALEIHVLDTVCAQIRRWLDAGFDVPRISVNLSAGRVSDSGLPARVQQCLDSHGVPSRYLMFEITETVAIQGMLQAVDTLKQFARMGVDVALDDFGTGHSSLSYLEKLPIQQLKIDRSFIGALTDGTSQQSAIVRSIVALAHSLDLAVVAEGVETEDQLRYIVELECDEMQGFLFSHAVPADAFADFMRDASRAIAPSGAAPRYG